MGTLLVPIKKYAFQVKRTKCSQTFDQTSVQCSFALIRFQFEPSVLRVRQGWEHLKGGGEGAIVLNGRPCRTKCVQKGIHVCPLSEQAHFDIYDP